jgi:hypothetical protein
MNGRTKNGASIISADFDEVVTESKSALFAQGALGTADHDESVARLYQRSIIALADQTVATIVK